MTSGIDVEQAWNDFVEERSFQKATSIQGQLDTITTMLSDIKNDTERVAMQSQAAPPGMPPVDGAGMGDIMPPADDGELMDAPAGTPPEGSEMPMAGGIDESMPPELPEDMPPASGMMEGPVDMPPEEVPAEGAMEPEPVGEGELPETDLIGQIKTMINTTQDNDQLKGLANLLSTALSQNQPAAPMQGAEMAETAQTSLLKSADKEEEKDDDEDDEEKSEGKSEEEPETESKDDVETETTVVDEEPEGMPEAEIAPEATIGQDVAAAVADVVEEIVDAALEQPEAVVEMAEEVAQPAGVEASDEIAEDTESFAESVIADESPVMKSFADMFAAKIRVGVDGMPATMAKSAFDASGAPADAPPEDDKQPQDVPNGAQEKTEGEEIISSLNAESIGKSMLPSFGDMMRGTSAMDYAQALKKADVGQPKDADSLRSEGDMPSGDVSVPKDADSALEDGTMPTGDVSVPKDADSLRKSWEDGNVVGETQDPDKPIAGGKVESKGRAPTKEDMSPGGLFGNVTAQLQGEDTNRFSDNSKQASGIHIKSFAEMYGGASNFEKSMGSVESTRPAAATTGASIDRPMINAVKKSEEATKQPLQIGFGVDPHKSVEADWARFRAWKQSL